MTSQYAYAALNATNLQAVNDAEASCYDEETEAGGSPSRSCCRSNILSRVKDVVQSNIGLLLIVASQAFMSFMNVSVKKLNSLDTPVPTLELVLVRMLITYMCCMSYMLLRGVEDPWIGPKGVRLLLVLRGVTGFFGLFGLYYSLRYLSLSDAVVLTFLSPLTTAISGSCLLGETFTKREALAGVLSLSGVILIARPAFLFGGTSINEGSATESSQRLIAVGIALLGVLGATGAYTTLRAIGKRAHPLHAMTSFSAQCVVVSIIGLVATQTKLVFPSKIEWLLLLLLIGVFGFIAQVLLTMGLQRETASRGSLGIYTQIVFAGILERIFFHTAPSVLSAIGTIIIITSALYVVLTKETTSTSKPIALEHIDDTSMEEGLLARSEGLSIGAIGHISVDDFMVGVASPSMKRAPSPRPREDATGLLGDKELSVEKSVLEEK
ncbi:hypothetical protein CCMSSC00406_0003008 [Pleurotus cornucopiae]|uniref:Uncharacterized protein n=1 Tax=Pleurotus cornucopiae TaxID=5321 RepID=A0ACB7J5G4_PLECO|nr:hypothetical protein CCMSSC00406_0003008 [Pleurotus cornucopiae]